MDAPCPQSSELCDKGVKRAPSDVKSNVIINIANEDGRTLIEDTFIGQALQESYHGKLVNQKAILHSSCLLLAIDFHQDFQVIGVALCSLDNNALQKLHVHVYFN